MSRPKSDLVIGRISSGERVIQTRKTQINAITPELLKEAFSLARAPAKNGIDPIFVAEVWIGERQLKTMCVPTTSDDDVVWGYPVGRDLPMRFVKGREPADTEYITLVFRRAEEDGVVLLVTAYAGEHTPRMPDDPWATPDSKPFWDNHALVCGSITVDEIYEENKDD